MDVKSLFKETFDRAKRPLSDREVKAAKAVQDFVALANQQDDVDISVNEFGSNAERVTLSVSVDGGDTQYVLVKLSYNAPMSGRILASPITDAKSFMDGNKGTFYDLNQPEHRDLLLGEIIKAAATEAAKADHAANFRKALSTP